MLGLFTNLSLLRRTTGDVDTSVWLCRASSLIVEWLGAAVISLERLGLKSNLQQTLAQAKPLSALIYVSQFLGLLVFLLGQRLCQHALPLWGLWCLHE